MTDRICLHCKQRVPDDARPTENGFLHDGCWDAFNEEKPVEKSSKVAMIFGFSMLTVGAVVLSVGLVALGVSWFLLDTMGAQDPVVGLIMIIMMFFVVPVAFSAIPTGAIMLLIALGAYLFKRT